MGMGMGQELGKRAASAAVWPAVKTRHRITKTWQIPRYTVDDAIV